VVKKRKIRRWREKTQRRWGRRLADWFGVVENLWLVPGGWIASAWRLSVVQFWRWQTSRSFRSFLLGLPAVVVFLVVGYISIVAIKQSRSVLAERYDRQAQSAIAAKDARYSRLCLERVIQLRGEDTQTLMRLAEVYATQNDNRRVAALMTRLAPADRTTLPEAHLWKAQSLLAKKQLSSEELDEVEKQLANALSLRPQDPAARSLLGQVYAQTGRAKQAADMYRKIADRTANDSFRLAEISASLADTATARQAAQEALEKYVEKLQANPKSWEAREDVVKTQVFLERFEDAVETLRESRDFAGNAEIRSSLARVYGTWTQLLQQQGADVPKRISLIELTLRADPNSVAALDSIANLLSVADEAQLTQLRAILQRMLAIGQSAPLVHLCIGTDAILHDNLPDGIKHLQLAYQGDPTLIAAANNLAWAMTQAEKPPLDQALSLVDTILLREPDLPAVRDTRGQILLKLQRWDEAITDLEFALRGMPESEITRQSLVTAYESVGLSNLAQEHAKLLDALRKQRTQSSPMTAPQSDAN